MRTTRNAKAVFTVLLAMILAASTAHARDIGVTESKGLMARFADEFAVKVFDTVWKTTKNELKAQDPKAEDIFRDLTPLEVFRQGLADDALSLGFIVAHGVEGPLNAYLDRIVANHGDPVPGPEGLDQAARREFMKLLDRYRSRVLDHVHDIAKEKIQRVLSSKADELGSRGTGTLDAEVDRYIKTITEAIATKIETRAGRMYDQTATEVLR